MKSLLEVEYPDQLLTLDMLQFEFTDVSLAEFVHIFKLCRQYWMHDGNNAKPHAKLTSGKCSNGFINCWPVLSYPRFCMIMAQQCVRQLRKHYEGPINWVIGSSYSSIDLTHDIAYILGARHGFTEKGPEKQQLWSRMQIAPGETVLQAEEFNPYPIV